MKAEENERITRTGPGTPAGEWMRRYWQPVALAEELESERPLASARVLGEDLVVFRDDRGKLGLIERRCAHRGADLAYGRLEDGGLRCYFHGWLFSATGACLETPAEPAESRLKERVCLRSYPVVERNGILWGYLGPASPPPLPPLDCFRAPDAYTFAFKAVWECNWLQALEVGIDPAHTSYLHRFVVDDDPNDSYGKQFRSVSIGGEAPLTKIMRDYVRPDITVEHTPYGLRITSVRRLGEDGEAMHLRVTHQVFPHGFVIPLSPTMTITQWHVPIDDTSCYWYAMFTSMDAPVDKAEMRRQRIAEVTLPEYRPILNRHNRYGFDPANQRTLTYTGLGPEVNTQDQMAVEGQGPIHDRTREHLGRTDKAIIAYRRGLLQAIDAVERGERPLFAAEALSAEIADAVVPFDGITRDADWEGFAKRLIARQRALTSWRAADEGQPDGAARPLDPADVGT